MDKNQQLIITPDFWKKQGAKQARQEYNQYIAPVKTAERTAALLFFRMIGLLDGAAAIGHGKELQQFIMRESPKFTAAADTYHDVLISQRRITPKETPQRIILEANIQAIEDIAAAYKTALNGVIDGSDATGQALKNIHAMGDDPTSPFYEVFHPDINQGGRPAGDVAHHLEIFDNVWRTVTGRMKNRSIADRIPHVRARIDDALKAGKLTKDEHQDIIGHLEGDAAALGVYMRNLHARRKSNG